MINVYDSLKIIKNYNISIEDIDVLMNLYRRVLGIDVIKVYLSLIYNDGAFSKLSDFLKDFDLDSYEFNRYKQSLEEVSLVTTFVSSDESNEHKYIINVLKPNGAFILKNVLFRNKLKDRVSEETYISLLEKYVDNYVIPENYKQVTAPTLKINEKDAIALNNYQEKASSTYTKSIVYDIKELLSDNNIRNSSLYPVIATNESLEKITKILEIAGISPETFRTRVLVKFIGESTIDFEKMKLVCFNCKETMNYDSNKGYLNPCAVFLKKIYGFEPEFYDKKLADLIYNKYGFSIDVINYILEYCLISNDKKLNTNYVGRVCSTVKLKNIITLEALKKYLVPKNVVEFKRVEEKDRPKLKIDSKAIDAELAEILKRRS